MEIKQYKQKMVLNVLGFTYIKLKGIKNAMTKTESKSTTIYRETFWFVVTRKLTPNFEKSYIKFKMLSLYQNKYTSTLLLFCVSQIRNLSSSSPPKHYFQFSMESQSINHILDIKIMFRVPLIWSYFRQRGMQKCMFSK